MRNILHRIILSGSIALLATSASVAETHQGLATFGTVHAVAPEQAARLEASLSDIVARHRLTAAAFGVIKGGHLQWEGYAGESHPGERADRETLFNVASITKTVFAETALRLVSQGDLSLTEPMATWWRDPDVVHDTRINSLTLENALTHSTGFPNWRFFKKDGKLAFDFTPGSAFQYSGEGFEYARRYMEAKLGRSFQDLADELIFAPLDIKTASLVAAEENGRLLVRPLDEDGKFFGYYCRPGGYCREPGSTNAAADLAISLPDYARFFESVIAGDGLDPKLAERARRIVIERDDGEKIVDCGQAPPQGCPIEQGYGLGLEIVDYGKVRMIGHSGWDWAQVAVAYYYEATGDGVIIFL